MLIDGNSIINRAFYGLMGPKMLSNSEGFYTNAIFGFLNILIKFINDENPTHLVVAFDMKSPTFRHVQYENYKAHRKGMPQELAMQVPVLKEVLDAMNIRRVELEGYEADDIIGTLAVSAENSGISTLILSGDRDALQLANEKVKIKIPITRTGRTDVEEYDYQQVINKYGVTPKQLIDVKALMGDASDNIPGVPGVGEKTALEIIKKYGSIDSVYESINSLDMKERVKNLLIENVELAKMSKKLATIEVNAPINLDVCDCKVKEYNISELLPILRKLEFNSIISKLGLIEFDEPEQKELSLKHKCLKDITELSHVVSSIQTSKEFAYFLVMNKKNYFETEIIGISFCWEEDKTAYIHLKGSDDNNHFTESIIKEIISNKGLKKFTFNAKPHYFLFDSLGAGMELVDFDVMIAAYLIDPAKESYSLTDLSKEFLNLTISGEAELLRYQKNNYQDCDADEIAKIACQQSSVILRLTKVLKDKIFEDGQDKLYSEVELPLTRVLADIEKAGMRVDCEAITRLSVDLEAKIEGLTKEIINLAGENFNINSTKQLGAVLFEKLKLPAVRKTKTGYSTDAEVLETLAPKHPVIDKILEYRQMVKLKSTYLDGIKPLINPVSRRIHTNFNQTVTVTGRISSTEPNLQNIPIKLEMGKQIRKIFEAPEGCWLVDADYSQIELRVLAHIADDKNMIEAFKNGEDIHRITAAQVFGVKEEEVTSLMRSRAKAINFGIVYGIGDFSLAKDLRITRKQAKSYIESYLEKYSGVRKYMHEIVETGKERGYVTTLLGRRRYLPELHASNFNIRSFGERVAMNTPIQGTAADIIKVAMVKVHNEIKSKKLKSRLILQVHDELIVEAPKEELEEVKSILKDCMESAVELAVQLEVDIHWGSNWYEVK